MKKFMKNNWNTMLNREFEELDEGTIKKALVNVSRKYRLRSQCREVVQENFGFPLLTFLVRVLFCLFKKILLKGVKDCDAEFQAGLGIMYYLDYIGDGVPKNYNKAIKWLTKAANQGSANAQAILGLMYITGHMADLTGNFVYFMNDFMYYNYIGDGVPKNYNKAQKAEELLKNSANQGYASAQYILGIMYGIGIGIPQDSKKAVQLWSRAARQRHKNAQRILREINTLVTLKKIGFPNL